MIILHGTHDLFCDSRNGTLNLIMNSKNMEDTQLLKIQGLKYTPINIFTIYILKNNFNEII